MEEFIINRIKLFGKLAYGNLTNFALILGYSYAHLSQYLNQTTKLSFKLLRVLYENGCSLDWLMSGDGSMYADNEKGRELRWKIEGKKPHDFVTIPSHIIEEFFTKINDHRSK